MIPAFGTVERDLMDLDIKHALGRMIEVYGLKDIAVIYNDADGRHACVANITGKPLADMLLAAAKPLSEGMPPPRGSK